MTRAENSVIIVDEVVMSKIYIVRGEKIMLDRDLAELYQIETKYLKRQVKRNIERFPDDFMMELTAEEVEVSRCQIGTLKRGENIKYLLMLLQSKVRRTSLSKGENVLLKIILSQSF